MSLLLLPHWLTVLTSLVLGALVWAANPRRLVNQTFLLISCMLAGWLTVVGAGILARDEQAVVWIVRTATSLASFTAPLFNLLRVAMTGRATRWGDSIRQSGIWLLSAVAISLLCFSPWLVQGARLPADAGPGTLLEPLYGPGIHLYAVYLAGSLLLLIRQFIRDMRSSRGIQRLELQFTMLGSALGILIALLTAVLIPILTRSSQTVPLLPLAVIALDGITAYGIATRRILHVAGLIRRGTAYLLLAAYLTLVYLACWMLAHLVLAELLHGPPLLAHLAATLVTTFSLAPANGLLQRFANRLFLNTTTLDATDLMQRANRVLNSVTTLDDLLRQFAMLLSSAFGTDRVTIILNEDGAWRVRYPPEELGESRLHGGHPIIQALAGGEEALVAEVLARFRAGPFEQQLTAGLRDLQASIAVGIHAPTGLRGLVLLGRRLSGRIYGWDEQRSVQVLANQLSVGLENTALYTRLQDSAIYNDILLDNLVTGVIAAGADGRITVYNREAQRIVGKPADEVLRQPLSILPRPMKEALETTLREEQGLRDLDLTLHSGPGGERPIRLGASLFHSHTGKKLGALLVFNDLTAIKKLETQVRRTDRLASMGTLAAGMAHEIKNPLVTLKTFAQLLPERYEDPDFRETFSSLVGHEIIRIDSIVNQLLHFARPTKPSLNPMRLHEVVETTLRLVQQQLRQKGIDVVPALQAAHDRIEGDHDLLVQALLNFFLNAIEAMETGGTLTVATAVLPQRLGLEAARIRLSIRDTGRGIRSEDLPHIFDPFFTTKSSGTGLGLSVSHGIIQEHHATIDVESTEGRGAVFHLFFPLLPAEPTP